MYLHIGKDFIIDSKKIIAIFNINYVKNTKEFKALYKDMEEKNEIIRVSDRKEKSFILIEENKNKKAYITNINVNTIVKRVL